MSLMDVVNGISKTRWGWVGFLVLTASVNSGCQTLVGPPPDVVLSQLENNPDPNARYLAYGKLTRGKYRDEAERDAAVKLLAGGLDEGKEPIATRALICRVLGDLGGPKARQALLTMVNDPQTVVRSEACRALGHAGQPEDATVLARVMMVDVDGDCRVAGIDGLGFMKTHDPRILEVLVEGMENPDPAIRHASYDAIRACSDEDFGAESKEWRRWFESTHGKIAKSPKPPTAPTGKAAEPNPTNPTGMPYPNLSPKPF